MDIKEQDLLGDSVFDHWYYTSKAAAVSHVLQGETFNRILDVGAGSGFFSRHLLSTTPAAQAMCVDPNYDQDTNESVDNKPLLFRRSAEDYPADLVLLMDVLEHVDDDVALLTHYTRALKPGTKVLITVPAFPFLWSGHDVFLEHRRRYTLETLRPVVKQSGLNIVNDCYGFGLLFPLAAAMRMARRLKEPDQTPHSDLKVHHPLINAALKAICTLERPLMSNNTLMGLSVFCLAEKA